MQRYRSKEDVKIYEPYVDVLEFFGAENREETYFNIYQKQGNVEAEKEVLRKAISNCKKNDEFKKRLNEIN